MADLKTQTPTDTIDTLGRMCPYPLVHIIKRMRDMGDGTLLKVLCDSPISATDDIPMFAKKSGYDFDSEKVGNHWELYIKKSSFII